MELACCGGERKHPLCMGTTERLLASSLRTGERVQAAAPAVALWDLRPPVVGGATPFGEPCRQDFSAAFLVVHDLQESARSGGHDREVALLGIRVGWLSREPVALLPLCAGVLPIFPAFADSEALDLQAAGAAGARFCLVLPRPADGTEASTEQRRLLAELAALEGASAGARPSVAGGFPCRSGAFDWLWSYAPPASFPPGLERPPPAPERSADPELGADPARAAPQGAGEAPLSLLSVTLNCGGRPPPAAAELLPLFGDLAAAELVVVALQEICPLYLAFYPSIVAGSADSDAAQAWAAALDEALVQAAAGAAGAASGYTRVFLDSLVGLLLAVWVRADAAALLEGEPAPCGSVARCGAYGAGNKGAVAASLSVAGRRLCIVDVHLAAGYGPARAGARVRDFEEVLWQLGFGTGRARRNALEHDLLLVTGDFNFRLGTPAGAGGGEAEPLLLHDSLATTACEDLARWMEDRGDEGALLQRAGRGPWALLREAPVAFPPTYKFQPGEDVRSPTAAPAWCDRAFWWVRPDCFAAAPRRASYGQVAGVRLSDHRPVCLALELTPLPGAAPGASAGRPRDRKRQSFRAAGACGQQ